MGENKSVKEDSQWVIWYWLSQWPPTIMDRNLLVVVVHVRRPLTFCSLAWSYNSSLLNDTLDITMRSTLLVAVVLAIAFGTTVDAQMPARRLEYQAIALTGERALGPDVEAYYQFFHAHRISDSGRVVIEGTMYGDAIGSEDRLGPWAGMPDDITNVIHEGHDFPTLVGTVRPQISSDGELAVLGLTSDREGTIWTGFSKPLEVAVREGDRAPGTEMDVVFADWNPNDNTQNFFGVQFDGQSQLAFSTFLSGPGISQGQHGLWAGSPDDLHLVARSDSQAYGLPAGVTYRAVLYTDIENGTVAYRADLQGPGITDANDYGVWCGSFSDVRLVAREGDAAPGIPSASFSELNLLFVKVDAAGEAVFNGRISGPQVDASNDFGVWLGGPGGTQLLFRSGDPITSLEGVRLGDSFRVEPVSMGQYTMVARLAGQGVTADNDTALFFGTPGDMRLIAREGELAPGAGPNAFFRDFISSSAGTPGTPSGVVGFYNQLRGSGVDADLEGAFYLVDTDGTLFLVARGGDMFDIGDGVLKQIGALGIEDGPIDGTLNSQGQLTFQLRFTDNTQGIFVAQIVPEPTSPILAVFGVVSAFALGQTQWRRKRRDWRKRSNANRSV